MTAQHVTDRHRRRLLPVPGWIRAPEEDNEHVRSSGLDRGLSWLAVATGVAAFGFFAGTLVLGALIADPADQAWSQALAGAAVAVPGTLIAARRPRHPIGWLLLLAGVGLAVPAFGAEYARYTFAAHPGALPGGDWWFWVSSREGAMAGYALPFLLLLFPTGYLLSRRWRPVAWLIFAAVTAEIVLYAFLAGGIDPSARHLLGSGIRNPVGLFGDAQRDWPRIAPLLTGLSLLALGLGLAGGIARFRRSRGEERQQLKWVAYALAVVAVLVDNGAPTRFGGLAVLHAVAGVGFAAAVTIAVYKYRLYDIDIIINRTLVYLLLSGIIAGGYIAIVTGIGALVPRHGLAIELLAAGLAAVVFSPLRNRLQALVNRMMYGERDDPYAALSKLATRLEATLSPDEVLPAIVDNVASALRSPYAAIEVPDGDGTPRLAAARKEVATCAISGAVGTFANIDPRVEAHVAKKLGLEPEPISTQVIPRDRHAQFFMTLALIAAAVERLATEIRHLQRTEVGEAEEYFAPWQKGSSAMPHKRNPVLAENLTGLARVVRSAVVPALENVALWHERDISHSSVERVIAPDATIALDFALARLTGLVDRLVVYPERMRQNLEALGGLVESQRVLLALTQAGMSREDAYRLVQKHAMASWRGEGRFAELLKADPEITRYLTPQAIDASFDTAYHLKQVDTIFRRVFGD